MDQSPLVTEHIDAGARFLLEFQKYAPIQVAFWIKEQEDGHWYLFVASDQITDENFDRAYGEVGRIAQRLRDPHFDSMRVKVIGTHKSRAKAILKLQERYPDHPSIRFYDEIIAGRLVEQGYIYPSPIPCRLERNTSTAPLRVRALVPENTP
jgi:hypothetical protein